ncbi:hypothetical protein E2C01_025142 [Portunus trituberculatus]|uniref:Uncharacterized protein n=1 Tax=Portunus trituberculatus TaxID=210409 RepID=A0A5B7ECD2_PORTR|nr:hypothetical protein [Portunus trituberculatus]
MSPPHCHSRRNTQHLSHPPCCAAPCPLPLRCRRHHRPSPHQSQSPCLCRRRSAWPQLGWPGRGADPKPDLPTIYSAIVFPAFSSIFTFLSHLINTFIPLS